MCEACRNWVCNQTSEEVYRHCAGQLLKIPCYICFCVVLCDHVCIFPSCTLSVLMILHVIINISQICQTRNYIVKQNGWNITLSRRLADSTCLKLYQLDTSLYVAKMKMGRKDLSTVYLSNTQDYLIMEMWVFAMTYDWGCQNNKGIINAGLPFEKISENGFAMMFHHDENGKTCSNSTSIMNSGKVLPTQCLKFFNRNMGQPWHLNPMWNWHLQ